MHAPEPDEQELSIRGELENSSVPELLRSLLQSAETGVLTLRSGDVTKRVYLHKGRVAYASSSNPDERLGESLLVAGRLSARQYVEASKRVGPGRRLGAILVELGALEPEELIPAVEHQLRELLMELFTWTHGEYELVIKDLDPGAMVPVSVSTENLILEGIRRSRSWSQVLRGIGDIEAVPVATGPSDALYKLDLTHEEQEVLASVNGSSSVEQICDTSYLSHFETCRTLWALMVLGVIRRGQPRDAQSAGAERRSREEELDLETIVEKFNQMFSRVYGFLKGRLGGQADEFMELCLNEVSRQYASLFGGVDLRHYGRADYEQMLANVADLPALQRKSLMVAGLNELVFVVQLNVRTRFGPEEEAVVSGIFKDGLRRLGPT